MVDGVDGKELNMHRNRNDDNWPELKGKPKQQGTRFSHKPLDNLDVKRNNLDDNVDDLQKIKKDRADKHLHNVKNMLQGMATYHKKNFKSF